MVNALADLIRKERGDSCVVWRLAHHSAVRMKRFTGKLVYCSSTSHICCLDMGGSSSLLAVPAFDAAETLQQLGFVRTGQSCEFALESLSSGILPSGFERMAEHASASGSRRRKR